MFQQLHVANERQADELIEAGVRGEPGGPQGQVELGKRGPVAVHSTYETGVRRIESDVDALFGGHLGGVERRHLFDHQAQPARVTVLEPEHLVLRGAIEAGHDDAPGLRLPAHRQRPAGVVLELLGRQGLFEEKVGEEQPALIRAGSEFEAITRLKGSRWRTE